MLAVEEKRLADYKTEKLKPDLKRTRLAQINECIDLATRRIHDLKKWSFLVAAVDPLSSCRDSSCATTLVRSFRKSGTMRS
jgi:hypothetical protein